MGFDDYGGELEIHKLDFSNAKGSDTLVGKAKAKYVYCSSVFPFYIRVSRRGK
jgi:hypothetical protein